jgi:hypothetical protein
MSWPAKQAIQMPMLVVKEIALRFISGSIRWCHLGGPLLRAVTSEVLIPFDLNLL